MGHHYSGPYVATDIQGDIWVGRRGLPPCDSPTVNLVAHPPCRPRLNALVFNVDLYFVLVAEEPLCLGGFLGRVSAGRRYPHSNSLAVDIQCDNWRLYSATFHIHPTSTICLISWISVGRRYHIFRVLLRTLFF